MSLPVFIHPDLSAARTGEAFSFLARRPAMP